MRGSLQAQPDKRSATVADVVTRQRGSDLYGPVRRHLEALGYTVRSEVGKCDVLGASGDSMVAVDLKLAYGIFHS
jgi:hypothetical protein